MKLWWTYTSPPKIEKIIYFLNILITEKFKLWNKYLNVLKWINDDVKEIKHISAVLAKMLYFKL